MRAAVLVLSLLAAIPGDSFRSLSLEGALEAARREKKLVFLTFLSADSEPCKRLEKLTFPEGRVRTLLTEKVVAIRVDLAPDSELARRFHVQSSPAILFLDPEGQGTEVDRISGFVEPRSLLLQAKDTIAGKDALFRARAKVAEDGDSPRAHLNLARLLLDRGLHAEALEQLLWCFDHGAENDPAFAETRATAVLPEILRLGQAYPAALEELAHRSDAAGERILAGKDRPRDVADVILLDLKLARLDRLTAIYDFLGSRPERSEAKKQLAPHVLVVLLADRRYAEALDCIGDPIEDFEQRAAAWSALAKKAGSGPDAALDRTRRETVRSGSESYEILLGAERAEGAAALVERILVFDPRVETYEALMEAAVRAGASPKAAEIGRRGVASNLSLPDKWRLKTALSELPAK